MPLVFGRDTVPDPWGGPVPRPECEPGLHIVDEGTARCTECGWLVPDVQRCETVGCLRPADYLIEAAKADDEAFTNVLRSAYSCPTHAFGSGIAMIPDGPQA